MKYILILVLLISSLFLQGQDTLFMKNGLSIPGKFITADEGIVYFKYLEKVIAVNQDSILILKNNPNTSMVYQNQSVFIVDDGSAGYRIFKSGQQYNTALSLAIGGSVLSTLLYLIVSDEEQFLPLFTSGLTAAFSLGFYFSAGSNLSKAGQIMYFDNKKQK